jgi:CDGSH-type Zn-finger protein/uncharacterized Fe-S cluster protein YjdI
MSDQKTFTYPGQAVDVQWDGRLCIHIGECGRADNTLFEGGRKPWCQPDLVGVEQVQDVVARCPTGALTIVRKDGAASETPAAQNVAVVANNGPLYLSGDLTIGGAADDMEGVNYRAALCRCGASQNKPFCDNSHERAGFVDRGAVGKAGPGIDAEGGPLTVKRAPNGPLLVSGNLTVVAASGRAAWKGTKAAFCRCGLSKNKPFCDGAHAAGGFTAE